MQKAPVQDIMDPSQPLAADAQSQRLKTLIHTSQPEEAKEFLSGLYGRHALQIAQGPSMDLHMRGCDFEGLHIGVIRYGSQAVAVMDDQRPMWVFSYLHKGHVSRGNDTAVSGPGDAGVNAPDDVREVRMSSDMEIVNLRVYGGDMNNACRAMLGSELSHPLTFDTLASAGTSQARTLMRLIDRFAAMPLYEHAAARQLERNLKSAALLELLLAWPNSYTTHLGLQPALPMSTQRARDYIHAHAADLPTVADIAQACDVGVRALSRGFEKHFNTSPQQYMIQHRLERVRHELVQGGTMSTVTDVAFKWGFLHLGTFAARYRQCFGELPSETLRRARH